MSSPLPLPTKTYQMENRDPFFSWIKQEHIGYLAIAWAVIGVLVLAAFHERHLSDENTLYPTITGNGVVMQERQP